MPAGESINARARTVGVIEEGAPARMEAYLPVVGGLIGEALQLTRTNAELGARVHVQPCYLHGFTRVTTD